MQQRYIIGVLKIRFANNARLAVGTAAIMSAGKTIEAKDSKPSPRQMKRRGTANSASATHDYVIGAGIG